ncbi:TetR/AcrR family transcriptional regulator [Actinomadura rugatobispora]|uniref:TetR/AcrR family transcriptional regulator n=1 Tax=Actinomadura rugatobispora TaxID=1994 RepID=A0ABW1A2V2_9ACTN|nr:hypothetical protein GCM10010200_091290 [Actinomadura rugatobispora]
MSDAGTAGAAAGAWFEDAAEVPESAARRHGVRRRLVMRHAARLFIEKGYAATTVDDIGRAAGVTGPAVYRHFPTKRALLASVVEDGCDQLARRTGDAGTDPDLAPGEALAELVEAYIAFIVGHRHLALLIEDTMPALDTGGRAGVLASSRRFRGRMLALLREASPDLPEAAARLAVTSVVGMCRNAIRARTTMSDEALRRRLAGQAMAVLLLPADERSTLR